MGSLVQLYVDITPNNLIDRGEELTSRLLSATWDSGVPKGSRVALEGGATFVLDNSDGAFNFHDATAKYYNQPFLGKAIQFLYNPSGPMLVPRPTVSANLLWTGWIQEYTYQVDEKGQKTLEIRGTQTFERFGETGLRSELLKDATAVDALKSLVALNPIYPPYLGLTQGYIDIDSINSMYVSAPPELLFEAYGSATQTYSAIGDDWSSEQALQDVFEDIAASELGYLFIQRDGRLRFMSVLDFVTASATYSVPNDAANIFVYGSDEEYANEVEASYTPREWKTGYIFTHVEELDKKEFKTVEVEPANLPEGESFRILKVTSITNDVAGVNVSYRLSGGILYITLKNNTNVVQNLSLEIYGEYISTLPTKTVKAINAEEIKSQRIIRRKQLDLSLVSTELRATQLATLYLAQFSNLNGKFKSLTIMDRDDYWRDRIKTIQPGRVIEISHDFLDLPAERAIVLAESGSWTPQLTTVTYDLEALNPAQLAYIDVDAMIDESYIFF